jgi:hypothetical protein
VSAPTAPDERFSVCPCSVAVGTRTMQEGGALGPWKREQVELFCVDNLMMVEINTSEDWIFMDFTFPTKASSEPRESAGTSSCLVGNHGAHRSSCIEKVDGQLHALFP